MCTRFLVQIPSSLILLYGVDQEGGGFVWDIRRLTLPSVGSNLEPQKYAFKVPRRLKKDTWCIPHWDWCDAEHYPLSEEG